MKNMWYEGNISEKDYLDSLKWIAKRYKNDDTIIAYDLKNEPHGKANESPRAKWDDSTDSDNWKYIAEKAAKSVFAGNPNALVMVEGIEIYPTDIKKNGDFSSTNMGDYYCTWWGGNLRGVRITQLISANIRTSLYIRLTIMALRFISSPGFREIMILTVFITIAGMITGFTFRKTISHLFSSANGAVI